LKGCLITNIAEQFGDFSFQKLLLLFPQSPFKWQTLPSSQLKQKQECSKVGTLFALVTLLEAPGAA